MLNQCTKNRRDELMANFFFHCECSLCLDTHKNNLKSSLRCKKCEGCVPTITGTCVDCDEKYFSAEDFNAMDSCVQEYLTLRNEFGDVMVFTDRYSKEEIDSIYRRAIDIFHPFDLDLYDFITYYSEESLILRQKMI